MSRGKGSVEKSLVSAYLTDIRRSRPSTSSNRKLAVLPFHRGFLRNHVARRCKLPQTSRYLKKKKKRKNANYLCLINIHDIRPHRYAPQSNPFLLLPPPSPAFSLDLPASSFLTERPTLLTSLFSSFLSIQPSVPPTKKDYGNS